MGTGGLNAMGVASRGKALAIEPDVKLAKKAYNDMQAKTANFLHVGQFKGSAGSFDGSGDLIFS